MKNASRALIVATALATAGLAYAQTDNSAGTLRSNRTDPSEMTTPPAGAEPPATSTRDERRSTTPSNTSDRRPVPNSDRGSRVEPQDPSKMTTHPEGATPSGARDSTR